MPDFRTLQAGYSPDKDLPPRASRLLALTRVIEGSMYDELQHPFAEEKNGADEYIPLAKRRPSARTRFCATVVNDAVSMLFSEGHFPSVDCHDEPTRDALTKVISDSNLNVAMIDASTRGSVGSVAILMRVLGARVFWKVMPAPYLTPTWQDDAPDVLESVTERYKVKGEVLRANGYAIADADLPAEFWFQRTWDDHAETWFVPQRLDEAKKGPPAIDTKNTVRHELGFVPIAWVRNLPGGDEVDGAPTFPLEAIDMQIEADYLLSQGGRGLKYQSDPTLHIKEPAFSESGASLIKGAANAIITSAEGDAKLLEISGDAATAVLDWVKGLRDLALEGAGGNRANADKLSAAQSGRAMELMNQSLIWLADKLRISYGEGALLELLSMVVLAAQKFDLLDKRGRKIGPMNGKEDVTLRWPQWYAPTYADKQTQAITLEVLRGAGLMAQETAVKSLAQDYDIADPEDELRLIQADQAEQERKSLAAGPKMVKQTVFRDANKMVTGSQEES